jgi:peptide/nickel transport system substrate-binding protein
MNKTIRGRLRLPVATALAAALALSLAACNEEPNKPAAATGGAESPGQNTDREVVIASYAGWTSLDPAIGGGIRDLSLLRSLYSALTQTDNQGRLQPDAATSWERTEDNVWRFALRQGLVFPNGEKLDAANVVWNLNRQLHDTPKPGNWISASISNITDIQADGDYAVLVSTEEPDLLLPQRLSGIYLVSKEFAASHDLNTEALGTGPYDLVSFAPDSEVTLKAKPEYYAGAAAFQNVRFVVTPDVANKINALKTGEVDLANIIDPADFEGLEQAGLVTGSVPSARIYLLTVNTNIKPLDDVRVRQAISLAIDRESIIESLLSGLVDPALNQNISAVYDAYNDELGFPEYDPAKAKDLLKQAGVDDGFEVEIISSQGGSIANEQIIQVIGQQLGEIGITAKVSTPPSSVLMERLTSGETAAGLTHIGFIDTAIVAGETLRYIGGTHSQSWTDVAPGYDEAVAAARSANTEEEKVQSIKDATQAALDNQQTIYLWPIAATYAHAKDLKWQARPDDYILPYEIKAL